MKDGAKTIFGMCFSNQLIMRSLTKDPPPASAGGGYKYYRLFATDFASISIASDEDISELKWAVTTSVIAPD